MFDRIFSALLTFAVLAAATLAIGAAWFEQPAAAAARPRVEVSPTRLAALQSVAACDPAAAVTRLR